MTYAEQLPDLIAAYKAELRKCDEAKRIAWHVFEEHIRTIDDIGRARKRTHHD